MLIVILFTSIINLCSCAAYKPDSNSGYSITVGAYADPSSISPQHEHHKLASNYFDTITKKIVLDDGRIVQCKIPLLSIGQGIDQEQLPKAQKEAILSVRRNLTEEEAEPIFKYLKDSCTRYRMKDFLWELCFQKYARQYDDYITMLNARKPRPELFFVGFHKSVQPLKYISAIKPETGDYNPEYEHESWSTRIQLPNFQYIQTYGHILRAFNVKSYSLFKPETLYFMQVDIPAEYVSNDAVVDLDGRTLGDYVKQNKTSRVTKKLSNKSYIIIRRLILRSLSPYIFLMNQALPVDIATSHAKIFPYTEEPKIGPDKKKIITEILSQSSGLYLESSFLYGSNTFLSHFNPYTSILVAYNSSVINPRIIVQVVDDHVVRIDEPVIEDKKSNQTKILVLGDKPLMKDIKWSQGKGKVWIIGSVILGRNTSFTKDYSVGDLIMLIDVGTKDWTLLTREVLRVVDDSVLLLRKGEEPPIHKIISSTETYLIGKYLNVEEYAETLIRRDKIVKTDEVSHINTDVPNSLLFMTPLEKIEEKELLCSPSLAFPSSESWLMTFEPRVLDRRANLMIHLASDYCSRGGIQINFAKMQQVVIMDLSDKSKVAGSLIHKAPNGDILMYGQDPIWIMYQNGSLRVGVGNEISLKYQLVSFEVDDAKKLAFFSINKQFSYNVKLLELQISTLQDFSLEALDLVSNAPKVEGDVAYFEHYGQGSVCDGPTRLERRVDIEYRCSKDGEFYKIEDIKEPSMCHYHMVVGTNLLCPKVETKIKLKEELASSINCLVIDS